MSSTEASIAHRPWTYQYDERSCDWVVLDNNNGWRASFRYEEDAFDVCAAMNSRPALVAALQEVKRDIERAHKNNVIWPSTVKQIDAALAHAGVDLAWARGGEDAKQSDPQAPSDFFERVPASGYVGGSRRDSIQVPYAAMVAALGRPHMNADIDFPDDPSKVDVCWCVRSTITPGDVVTFWNYKNGPAYNDGEGTIDDLGHFSVYYSNEPFWHEIRGYITPLRGKGV